jgi:hypothetical protein
MSAMSRQVVLDAKGNFARFSSRAGRNLSFGHRGPAVKMFLESCTFLAARNAIVSRG